MTRAPDVPRQGAGVMTLVGCGVTRSESAGYGCGIHFQSLAADGLLYDGVRDGEAAVWVIAAAPKLAAIPAAFDKLVEADRTSRTGFGHGPVVVGRPEWSHLADSVVVAPGREARVLA